MEFGHLSWPALKEAIEQNALIILPVGMLEEHGPHLPVATDSIIADGISHMVAERLQSRGVPTLVLPIINTGYTGVGLGMAGVLRVEPETLAALCIWTCWTQSCGMGSKDRDHKWPRPEPACLKLLYAKITLNVHDVSVIVDNGAWANSERRSEIRRSASGCGGHAD